MRSLALYAGLLLGLVLPSAAPPQAQNQPQSLADIVFLSKNPRPAPPLEATSLDGKPINTTLVLAVSWTLDDAQK